MKVFNLLAKLYPDYVFLLKELFPEMLETARRVPVLPWKEEYNVADKNPEIIETIQDLERLVDEGKITNEEFEKRISQSDLNVLKLADNTGWTVAHEMAYRGCSFDHLDLKKIKKVLKIRNDEEWTVAHVMAIFEKTFVESKWKHLFKNEEVFTMADDSASLPLRN